MLCTILFITMFFYKKDWVIKFAKIFLIIGFSLHTILLIYSYISSGFFPVKNIKEAASFLSWLIFGILIILQINYRLKLVGSFIAPFSFLIFLSSNLFDQGFGQAQEFLHDPFFPIHVFFATLGDACFIIAFFVSISYLIKEGLLKEKEVTGIFNRFPSLERLDDLNFKVITFGFIALTIGMVSGFAWLQYTKGTWFIMDPKVIFSVITWFFYVVIVHLRFISGFRGKKLALGAIIGFIIVTFTFIGTAILFKDAWHSF